MKKPAILLAMSPLALGGCAPLQQVYNNIMADILPASGKECVNPKSDIPGLATWLSFDEYFDGTLGDSSYLDSSGNAKPIHDDATTMAVSLQRPAGTSQILVGAKHHIYGMGFGVSAADHPKFTANRAGPLVVGHHGALDFGTDEDFTVDFWMRNHGCELAGSTTGVRAPPCNVIEFVKQDALTSSNQHWRIEAWNNNGSNSGIRFKSVNGSSSAYSSIAPFKSSTNPNTGEVTPDWTHYTFVVDRDVGVKVYVDGALFSTDSFNGHTSNYGGGRNVYIAGMPGATGGQIFDLDEFEIYKRALTPSEVSVIYNGKCKPGVALP